jgi:gas vesicle protein
MDHKHKKGSSVVAGLAGAVVGAAVGAAAVVLSDKNNRDKVKKEFNKVKKQGQAKVEELSDTVKDELDGVNKRVNQLKKQAETEVKNKKKDLKKKI